MVVDYGRKGNRPERHADLASRAQFIKRMVVELEALESWLLVLRLDEAFGQEVVIEVCLEFFFPARRPTQVTL